MGFGLEQEDRSLITPMVLTHPLHPIKSRQGNKCRSCGLDNVFPPDDIDSGLYTQFIIIGTDTMYYRCILSD